MKKLALAVVLSLVATLLFSSVALADDPIDDPPELQETDGGTAEWTDEEAAVGDHSVKLHWPAPYHDADNNYIVPRASVVIPSPSDLTINSVDSWSYWAKAPKNYAPNLTFYTDTGGDGSSDTTITAWPKNPDNTWTQIDETTIGGYQGAYIVWGSNPYPSYKFDWSAVQSSYGDGEILNLLIGKGVIGTNQDITAYVDDFTINGITYSFEPPPSGKRSGGSPSGFRLLLPDASEYFRCGGSATKDDIDFNDGTWRIQIPAGTSIRQNGHHVARLTIGSDGEIFTKRPDDVISINCRRGGEVTITMVEDILAPKE